MIMADYLNDLCKIYENLDFESSYKDYDPQIENVKAQANEICSAIEKYLQGTIAFYKTNKTQFFNNPSDMNSFEELKGMFERLRPTLAQYSEFK
jgi:hypothetical protein